MLGVIFTYGMTYGGTAAALANPYLGLLIYVCFAVLRPGVGLWYWSVPPGDYSKYLAGGVVLGWLIRGAGSWRFGRAKPMVACLIAFLFWNVLSAIPAVNQELAWERVEALAKIILVVVVGVTLIDSVEKIRQMAWVILLSHGYVAYDLNMNYFAGFNRLWETGFGGMDNNSMGITLVSCTGLGIFLCLSARMWYQKAAAVVSLGFMVHAILFSFSRGSMLGLILVVVASFLLIERRAIHYLMLVGGIGLIMLFTGNAVIDRFSTTFDGSGKRDDSAEGRLQMWSTCVEVAASNPVFGLGPHHFPVFAAHYGLTPMKEAHTTWLQVAAENGIPGITFLLVFYIGTVVRLWPAIRAATPVPDPRLRDTARMVIAATLGFMLTAQFVTLPGLEAPYYIVMLGLGALKLLSTGTAAPVPAVRPH